ncbi:glycosyltransferase family 4 protein [Mangrovibacterium marinum]|uniref:glycosyltransferase family 4 protein n=1 Tax=Mangrovibacterium marinum TaxID=1639118 RepID=UPI002A186CD3|nr:glycosyltransferase family 4 protein [Mangrovibacterium marinum]
MNITIICTLYTPYINGGAEKSTQLLAEGLAKSGHKVSIITTSSKNEFHIINGVEVYRLKNKNIYWRYPQRDKSLIKKFLWHIIDTSNYLYWHPTKKILKKVNPEIIHTNNLCGISTIVWSLSKKNKIPVVHTLRDYYLMCPQQAMIANGQACEKQCTSCKAFSFIKKRNSKYVDSVIGISDFILNKHLISKYFTNANIKCTIPNSVDIATKKSNRSKGRSIIGYLGRISPEKGLEYLIDSFLESENTGKQLWIAGNGNANYFDKIKLQAKSSKQIHFLGHTSAEDFLSKIDLLVVPSLWHEPFGRVIIEAFSMQVPVFASKNGGLPEIINDKVGHLFDTSSRESLTNLLNNFFSGKMCYDNSDFEDICSIYRNDVIISQYLKVYNKILNKK